MSGGARRHDETDPLGDGWCTPEWLAVALGDFDLDPCSNPRSNIRAGTRYSLEENLDGLRLPWFGSVFVNPPFSDPFAWSMRLAAHNGPWVALVKLDPTTTWFEVVATHADLWAPFAWRFKFERADRRTVAPNFPCALLWRSWMLPDDVAAHLWSPRSR